MAMAPQLIGDFMIGGMMDGASISTNMIPAPKIKQAQQEAFVVFFQYKEYKNGARFVITISEHEREK